MGKVLEKAEAGLARNQASRLAVDETTTSPTNLFFFVRK